MNNRTFLLASVTHAALRLIAFDPGGAGWKKNADGQLELKDGNPVWVDANGGERVMQGDTINRMNSEAAGLRRERDEARTALQPFEGLDAAKAREAIGLVAKIDQKKLIEAGEVDKVRKEIGDQFTAQLGEKDKVISTLQERNDGLIKSNAFSQSEFVRNKIAVPAEMFTATFGERFKVEDGKIVAYDVHNNRIMSKDRFGELATVDEAFEQLVEANPHKAMILKAPEHSGSGSGGGGGGRGQSRTMRRADFDKLGPLQSAQAAEAMAKGELTIAD